MASISLKNVKKIYDGNVTAVKNFDIEIADKEFVVLVGPSGCGKSTLLRMIAGLETVTGGEISIDGRVVNDLPPRDRDIAMVFQNYALYPHMTVYENMAFSLKLKKKSPRYIERKVREAAELLDISELLERMPGALSGGQRQRVAIGRAIVRSPRVFLMDEPLSNLDAKLKNQMRAEILKLRRSIDATFVYVTHDQTEAMTLGERIVVMKDGLIQQTGTPKEIFETPQSVFVAQFIGAPQANVFSAMLSREDNGCSLRLGESRLLLDERIERALIKNGVCTGPVKLCIRPEHIKIAPPCADGAVEAETGVSELMGSALHLHISIGGVDAVMALNSGDIPTKYENGFPYGQPLWVSFKPDRIMLFDCETEKSII